MLQWILQIEFCKKTHVILFGKKSLSKLLNYKNKTQPKKMNDRGTDLEIDSENDLKI